MQRAQRAAVAPAKTRCGTAVQVILYLVTDFPSVKMKHSCTIVPNIFFNGIEKKSRAGEDQMRYSGTGNFYPVTPFS